MENNTVDRRAKRTKRMLKDALSELLQEKSFNDISIKDLTTRADINRGTFYLHYIDKFDMLENIENEIIMELKEYVGKIALDFFNTEHPDKPSPFMIKLYEYFKENSRILQAILGSNADQAFQIKLKKYLESNLFDSILKNMSNGFNVENMLVPKEYFVSYVVSAHLGVIKQWLENGVKESPEEMASILSKMFLLGPYNTANIKGSQT